MRTTASLHPSGHWFLYFGWELPIEQRRIDAFLNATANASEPLVRAAHSTFARDVDRRFMHVLRTGGADRSEHYFADLAGRKTVEEAAATLNAAIEAAA